MAFLKQAKSEDEVKKLTLSGLKKAYFELSKDYTKILEGDYIYCGKCNSFLSRETFYSSNDYASGKFPVCKKCLMLMATDYDKKTNTYTDNKEKPKETLRFLDLPFIESTYNSALSSIQAEVNEKNRSTAWQQYITMVQSLPNWRGMKWKDSDFEVASISDEEETKINTKTIKSGKKRFGNGYSNEDYMFLENEYQDWITRYECNTKAQESIFERLSFKKWEINKATKSGQPTKDLDKTYQELLATANIQPRQSGMDSMADAQTLGTLIQKYEETRPLPDIDPELEDVDRIGLYIDSFYRGHACKMLGLKNKFTNLYEKVMSKYTVKPPEYDDETDSEILFDKIFGSVEDV
jgi:hypothetical protein